ncbi:MAG: hypothetical protein U5R06_11255 [candidate division KSB1 bacterium]|nr:hypothetical protein [candidate division KSB1 bacterium]
MLLSGERIQGQFGVPVWADNDGNLMAFGEARQGAARGKNMSSVQRWAPASEAAF